MDYRHIRVPPFKLGSPEEDEQNNKLSEQDFKKFPAPSVKEDQKINGRRTLRNFIGSCLAFSIFFSPFLWFKNSSIELFVLFVLIAAAWYSKTLD